MFGYVRPYKAKLSETEKERYGAIYCGLCHAMGKRYGFPARFTLNYDFAFLAMLFASAQDDPVICQKRCPAHPFRKGKGCICFEGLEIAADESVILTWHKLRDDVTDSGFWSGLSARVALLLFRPAYRKAAALRPEFDRQVQSGLAELHLLEENNSSELDRVADTFASLLKAAVPEGVDQIKGRVLAQILYHVGRWIYLADAWDDLAEDRKQGSYNALSARFGGKPEEHLEELRMTMTHSLKLCVSAFQLENFGPFHGIIENILYFGLPTIQQAVLSGTWRETRNSKEKYHE